MVFKKNLLKLYVLFFFFAFCPFALADSDSSVEEAKQQALALYATKNYTEAFNLLENLPSEEKNEDIFLVLSNISQENKNDNKAIQYLNKALDKDYTYYKAYYNLGLIFASRNSYLLASNNFELAIKYNKDFAPSYYNLAYCQIKLKNYDEAKKNLIKALELEPKNKDIYYNLALCYKELNKPKQAKKILDSLENLG